MYYTRAQFAKLLGTTVETLRYYEDCGLLQVEYDKDSKRYQYRDADLISVINIRLFRSINVPVVSIKEYMNGSHIESHTSLLDHQIESARQQIKYLVELQDQMIAMRNRCATSIPRLNTVTEEVRPEAFFFPLSLGSSLTSQFQQTQEWMAALPFTWISIVIPPTVWQSSQGSLSVTPALVISREYVGKYLPHFDPSLVIRKPSAVNYKTVIITDNLFQIPGEAIDLLMQYASAHGTHLTGTITGVLLDQAWQNDHFVYYVGISSDFEN
jgi:DNA-binding transcriptional MerR regulator